MRIAWVGLVLLVLLPAICAAAKDPDEGDTYCGASNCYEVR